MSGMRQAVRALCRIPGTAALSILTLGLGIAATTTTFSAVYAALLRPIPFDQPGRLAYLQITRQTATEGVTHQRWSYPLAGEVRGRARSFAALATFTRTSVAVSVVADQAHRAADRTEHAEYAGAAQVDGEVVSAGYFETLRVAPSAGRTFSPDEEAPGHAVAVIGDAMWRGQFGGDPAIAA